MYYCPATNNIDAIFHLQTLMNVCSTLLVMWVLPAPTHLDPSHVHATWDTVEMERHVMVSTLTLTPQAVLSSPTQGAIGGKKRQFRLTKCTKEKGTHLCIEFTAVYCHCAGRPFQRIPQRWVPFSLVHFVPARRNCLFLPPIVPYVGLDGTASVYVLCETRWYLVPLQWTFPALRCSDNAGVA